MQAQCAVMPGFILAFAPVMLNVQGKVDTKILPRIMKYCQGCTPLSPTHELSGKITIHSA